MTPKRSDDTANLSDSRPSVHPSTGITLLKKQIASGHALLEHPLERASLIAWQNTTGSYLVKAFGSVSPNVSQVLDADSDHTLYTGMGDKLFEQFLASKLANQITILGSCVEQLQTEIALGSPSVISRSREAHASASSKRVFVVHGHDDGARESVARFLEKLGLEPVILHEQPNRGATVIEKLEHNGDVSFAVVLLTPDDVGGVDEKTLKRRARQNVVLELGYFVGRLGRDHVCALHKEAVELPSDIHGVVYVQLDPSDGWHLKLMKELKAAGLPVDLSKVM